MPQPAEIAKWHRLIEETEALSRVTRLGLGRTWGLIHDGDYDAARASLDEVRSYANPALDQAAA